MKQGTFSSGEGLVGAQVAQDPAANERSAFQRWFEGSAVVDAEGNPLKVFHGTKATFSQFKVRKKGREVGFHFGTAAAAEARLRHLSGRGGFKAGSRTLGVYLSLKNPLRLPDPGNFTVYRLLVTTEPLQPPDPVTGATMRRVPGPLVRAGVLTQAEADAIMEAAEDPGDFYEERARAMLIDLVQARGYDGFVYTNGYEAAGSESYVVFRPEQIKSATGNRGTYSPESADLCHSIGTPALPWHCELSLRIAANPSRAAPPRAWLEFIDALPGNGVRPADIEWSGVREWLQLQRGRVRKEAVLEYLADSGVELQEVVKGKEAVTKERDRFAVELDALGYTVSENSRGLVLTERGMGRRFVYSNGWDGFVPEEWDEDGDEPPKAALRSEALEAARCLNLLYLQECEDEDLPGATRYARYCLPGGQNYREILLTLPLRATAANVASARAHLRSNKVKGVGGLSDAQALQQAWASRWVPPGGYRSPHWSEPNVLAHVRLTDRRDVLGRRVLFVEEIQSDWAQAARTLGFKGEYEVVERDGEFLVRDTSTGEFEASEFGPMRFAERRFADQQLRCAQARAGISRAPFVGQTDAWVALVIRRVVKLCVQEGYDAVAFISGQQSADRYGLIKRVREVSWRAREDGTRQVVLHTDGASQMFDVARDGVARGFGQRPLAQILGEKVAGQVMQAQRGLLPDLDLKVGGEGMLAFYDEIVPKIAADVVRKLGGLLVRQGLEWPYAQEPLWQLGFDVTPAMRERFEERHDAPPPGGAEVLPARRLERER